MSASVRAKRVRSPGRIASAKSPERSQVEARAFDALVEREFNPHDRFSGYKLRGLWFKSDSYAKLRNSSWLLRNSRVGGLVNPAALLLVVHEAQELLKGGEELRDVLEAFAELLVHP